MLPLQKLIKISLLNLLIVSIFGVLLRYKIAFSFPYFDQKYLLHAHSHFAFSGWVSQTLMVLIISKLIPFLSEKKSSNYYRVILCNLFLAYGMLISFSLQGYGTISILFSTLSIFATYYFAILVWKDLKQNNIPYSIRWFKAALVFNVVSSFGTFYLAYMMINKSIAQDGYLASVYFYLHFQYNGWFLFTCLGLFADRFGQYLSTSILKSTFWLFFIPCFPLYFLSTLWLPIPNWIYVLIVISAIIQTVTWFRFVYFIKTRVFKNNFMNSGLGSKMMVFAATALSIKILLQLGSTIPFLSTLAFGFRPIVIGYLHLILLGVITIFLLGYLLSKEYIQVNKLCNWSILSFSFAVIFNEMALMVQGVAAFRYIYIPFINEVLFIIALLLFGSLLFLNISQRKPHAN